MVQSWWYRMELVTDQAPRQEADGLHEGGGGVPVVRSFSPTKRKRPDRYAPLPQGDCF